MDISFQKATFDDSQTIEEILITSWQFTYKDILPKSYFDGLNLIDRTEKRKIKMQSYSDEFCYIVLHNNKSIGVVTFLIDYNKSINKHFAIIKRVYLLPNYIGKGVGVYVYMFILNQLIMYSCTYVELWIYEKNTRSIKFNLKLGFKPTDIVVERVIDNCVILIRKYVKYL